MLKTKKKIREFCITLSNIFSTITCKKHAQMHTIFTANLQVFNFVILMLIVSPLLAQPDAVSSVKVVPVQEVFMAPVRKIPASAQAKVVATINTESKGVVDVLHDVGGFVNKGNVLAELLDSQSILRTQELQDAVKSNQARYFFLKAEKERLQGLAKKNVISKTEVDENKSNYLSAKSQLSQSQSRLNQYKTQIMKLTIVAPYDGYILQQFTQVGSFLNSGDSLVEFMQADNLEIIVYVPLKYRDQVNDKSVWKVTTEQGKVFNAKISNFSPAAIGQSHTIEVHLNVGDVKLWPGEPVNVLVPTQAPQQVISVPRDALVIRRNGTYVYTVVDSKAVKVDVTTGMASGDNIEVNGSLRVGQTVIIRGNERLRAGNEVKIIN